MLIIKAPIVVPGAVFVPLVKYLSKRRGFLLVNGNPLNPKP